MPYASMWRAARPTKITEAMDQALAEIGERNDPFVAAASRRRLEQSEWLISQRRHLVGGFARPDRFGPRVP